MRALPACYSLLAGRLGSGSRVILPALSLGPLHLVVSYGLGACTFGLLVWNVAMTPLVGNYVLAISLMFVVAVIGFTTFSLQKILHW